MGVATGNLFPTKEDAGTGAELSYWTGGRIKGEGIPGKRVGVGGEEESVLQQTVCPNVPLVWSANLKALKKSTMEQRFRVSAADDQMPDQWARHLAENAGTGAKTVDTGAKGNSSGREWMAAQQRQQVADQQ